VADPDSLGVSVGDGLSVGESVGDAVSVGVGESVGDAVSVGEGLSVGVGESVGDAVSVGEGLSVGVGESDGDAVGDPLSVGLGVGVGVGSQAGLKSAAAADPIIGPALSPKTAVAAKAANATRICLRRNDVVDPDNVIPPRTIGDKAQCALSARKPTAVWHTCRENLGE